MKVSIMQPYLFPYIGYFQLIEASDLFVIGDLVQYIKRGWVNRNNYLNISSKNRTTIQFTFPVSLESHLCMFSEVSFSGLLQTREKYKRLISAQYGKAPYYEQVMPLITKIVDYEDSRLVVFIENSIKQIMEYIDISTPVCRMSDLKNAALYSRKMDKQERVVEMCRELGAQEYINPIGGTKLYNKDFFADNGIELQFIKTGDIKYKQYSETEFVENLSIVDVLMFNSIEEVKSLIKCYSII